MKPILVIDIGNTHTVFGVYDALSQVKTWRCSTSVSKSGDEYGVFIDYVLKKDGLDSHAFLGIMASSVVPGVHFAFNHLAQHYFEKPLLFINDPSLTLDITIDTHNTSEVGQDLIANALAAYDKTQKASLIIDFGTATTFTYVNAKGALEAVAIAPGLELSSQALAKGAAQLYTVSLDQAIPPILGTTTSQAIQAGLYWGYVSLVEGMIARISKQYGPLCVGATGGLSGRFSPNLPSLNWVDPDLTLKGLALVFYKNFLCKN